MNQVTRIEESDVEKYEPLNSPEPMAVGLARAEIDVQIATARRFPRSITRASENILTLVTMDEETAAECMYALPRGGRPIKGPSIRLAEIVFQCWGNARCDARVVAVDRTEKVVIAEGIYHDLETNSAGRATVRRSIVDKNGRLYKDDMITVTGNAACSIAKRNAILAGIPKSFWNRAYKSAEGVVAGDIMTLNEAREKAIKAFAVYGVKPEQIFPALGVGGLDDIGLDFIPVLRGMLTALKNGEATVEEMFNPRKVGSTHEKVANPLADEPAHDPETGVIQEPATAAGADEAPPVGSRVSSQEAESAAPQQGQPDIAGMGQPASAADAPARPADSPARTALLEKLRRAAEKGSPALKRAMGGLTEPEESLLVDADDAALGEIARKADEAKGGAP